MLMTWVYGPNDFHDRQKVWQKLKDLGKGFKTPWAVLGDFNEISSSKEKEGRGVK